MAKETETYELSVPEHSSEAAGPAPAAADPHFGELDVGQVYPLPSAPSDTGGEFMLGEEGQELQEISGGSVSAILSDQTVPEELQALIDGLSEDQELDLMLDVTPSSSGAPATEPVPELVHMGLPVEPAGSLVNLDQLFDTVGAKGQPDPFGETPPADVALDDTFWEKAPEEDESAQLPELFEPIAALDPTRALDNIFETLYAADES